MKKHKIEIEELMPFFLFANTPSYLFKHFRENSGVQDFGETTSLAEIKREVTSLISNLRTVEDIILLYAYVISLCAHNSSESVEFLEKLRKEYSNIKWLAIITCLVENSQTNIEYFGKIDILRKQKPVIKTNNIPGDLGKTIFSGGASDEKHINHLQRGDRSGSQEQ